MQKTTISETLYSMGLCATCRSAASCTFPRRADDRVRECLEFDGEVRERRSAGRASSAARDDDPPAVPGLCGGCDLRDSCTFPRGEGGVWFCEEYQ